MTSHQNNTCMFGYFRQIPVISDVPVGENLQDHVMSNGIEFYSPHSMTITPAKAENLISSWAYSMFGTGKILIGQPGRYIYLCVYILRFITLFLQHYFVIRPVAADAEGQWGSSERLLTLPQTFWGPHTHARAHARTHAYAHIHIYT